MKKIIILFSFALIAFLQNTKLYSQEETGMFYFLIGTEGNEKAIMYLNIFENDYVYGDYHINNETFGFSGNINGNNLDLKLYSENATVNSDSDNVTLNFDKNNIILDGKRAGKNINLSLANTYLNTLTLISYGDINYSYSLSYVIFDDDELTKYKNEIIERTDDLSSFDNRKEDMDDRYSYYENVQYLDNNIISIFRRESFQILSGGASGGSRLYENFNVYVKDTLKRIEIKDFLDVNNIKLLNIFNKKVRESSYNDYNPLMELSNSSDLNYLDFTITHNGRIIFQDGVGYDYQKIEFTFEELKPFVKKGSPLEYLFN